MPRRRRAVEEEDDDDSSADERFRVAPTGSRRQRPAPRRAEDPQLQCVSDDEALALQAGFSMVEARLNADARQEKAMGRSPAEVLADLQRGNARFWTGKATRPERSAFERRALISKQFPSVAILGCSDSRVPVEIVFDQGLGDMFVIRVAGNCLDTTTQASLQYAVKHLKVKVLIVMGHEACGLLHTGAVEEGSFQTGAHVNCRVDYERRRLVTPNHSMTHVLNAALRQVLGDNVDQRGSLCNDEKLRFDFTNKKALSAKQLRKTEEICQQIVSDALPVTATTMPLEEAQAIEGVRAVFGEVYPDPVRVVQVGDDCSIEFCGGTHMSNTAEAEAFVLVEETAVAKGIRRITAVTRDTAKEAIEEGKKIEGLVADLEALSAETEGLDKKAGAARKDVDAVFISATLKADLRNRIEGVQKKVNEVKKAALAQRVNLILNDIKEKVEAAISTDAKTLVLNVDIGADSKASQQVLNAVKKIAPDMAFMGLSEEEQGSGGKLMAFAVVPESLVDCGLKADEWVRGTLEVCGGRGGGKPGSAQGQAPECSDVDAVLAASESFAAGKVTIEA